MIFNYAKLVAALSILILIFAPNAYSKDDCDLKYKLNSEGKLSGGAGVVKTTKYQKNCYEWVQDIDSDVGGFIQKQKTVSKDGYIYTNFNGKWTKIKNNEYENTKKLRAEGKTTEDLFILRGGVSMNKESKEFLEPCSYWKYSKSIICYTDDWIPVYLENQGMVFKATEIKRGDSGPESLYEVPQDVPEGEMLPGS